MILVNEFDNRYFDGTPLSICQTMRVAVNEKKILYIYKQQSPHKEDSGMMYSVIVLDNGTDVMCKDDIGELHGFVGFKDVLINKDNVQMLQDGGPETIVTLSDKGWLRILNKFDEVVERFK